MAAEWRTASGGSVTVTIFPGGQLGDENKVVSLLRAGRPQAAALTTIGLSRLDPAYNVFGIPFFFDSYDELYAVLDRMAPVLDARLQKGGFTRLAWGNGGWVRVFSRVPVATLEDLKGVKLFTSAGEDAMVQWYKTHGFTPVALAMTDILTGLSSGQIDAIPTTPTAALAFQFYTRTGHMLDLGIAPLVGAIVVNSQVWGRIPAAAQPALVASAREMEARLNRAIPAQDTASIEEMKKRGLVVHAPAGAEWKTVAQSLTESLRGAMVPAEIYDLAVKERNAYRAARKP
jgi:TRAP-type C4-dicarboxylate transport system substrate-binding protein